MGVRGCGSVIKYSMFLFNAIILVAGCGLVGFGIYTRTNTNGLTKFSSILGSSLLPTISLVFIVTGAIIIFLSFLGCCGAIKEVRCMLVTFFVVLLLLFLCFIVGGILFYAFRNKIEDSIIKQMKEQLIYSYDQKGEEKVTEGWDYMQSLFHCCGVYGDVNSTHSWAIYKTHTNWFLQHQDVVYVPLSCCKDTINTPNITQCQGSLKHLSLAPNFGPPVPPSKMNDQLYTQGCYTSLKRTIFENLNTFIGMAAGIAAAMILGMVFSLCLCKKIREYDYDCDD